MLAHLYPGPGQVRTVVGGLRRASDEAIKIDYLVDHQGDSLTEVASILRRKDAYSAMRQVAARSSVPSKGFDFLKPLRAATFAGICNSLMPYDL